MGKLNYQIDDTIIRSANLYSTLEWTCKTFILSQKGMFVSY